jgi:para-aminobenzoate synthetase/4-amino-4-deoxychorismate lyase
VAIRTAVIFRNADGEMGIGSGVVFDSQGSKEYAECLLKMKFLTDPVKRFELIETMLCDREAGGFVLLERHIERLATSARYFAYVYDEAEVRRALDSAVSGKAGRLRVRLLLAEDGKLTVATTPLPSADPKAVMRFALSSSRVDSSDLFLFHKTTRRELYDREWQEYADRLHTDEVIYLNERGELAEGSRTTIFIERDGTLLTPQLGAGLLPGTLRAELIAEGKAEEAVLTLADLQSADAIFLGNSVRGLVAATRVDVVR